VYNSNEFYNMEKYTLPKIKIKLSNENIQRIFKSKNKTNSKNMRTSMDNSSFINNTETSIHLDVTSSNDNFNYNKNMNKSNEILPQDLSNSNFNNYSASKSNYKIMEENYRVPLNLKTKPIKLNNLNSNGRFIDLENKILINSSFNNKSSLDNKQGVNKNVNNLTYKAETSENKKNSNSGENTNEPLENVYLRQATMSPKRTDFVSDFLSLKRNKYDDLRIANSKKENSKNNKIVDFILENFEKSEVKEIQKIFNLLNLNKNRDGIEVNTKILENLNINREKIDMFLLNLNILNQDNSNRKNVRIVSPLKIKNLRKFDFN